MKELMINEPQHAHSEKGQDNQTKDTIDTPTRSCFFVFGELHKHCIIYFKEGLFSPNRPAEHICSRLARSITGKSFHVVHQALFLQLVRPPFWATVEVIPVFIYEISSYKDYAEYKNTYPRPYEKKQGLVRCPGSIQICYHPDSCRCCHYICGYVVLFADS